ncbi:hypothetical protein HY009_03120 [Candidatus Acetothermia bacterium]|nr:hypothetical protein [Candidatus Acetothermia bacterium]
MGAATQLRETIGAQLGDVGQAYLQRDLQPTREALGAERTSARPLLSTS